MQDGTVQDFNDYLNGGNDNNQLFGQTGHDTLDVARDVGGDTVLDFGKGDEIVLIGVQKAALDEDGFIIQGMYRLN